jgi:arginyl-tRNA synthetase
MSPEEIALEVRKAVLSCVESGSFQPIDVGNIDVVVERPKDRAHGDWASNIALQISKLVGLNPRETAISLVDVLSKVADFEKVELAGPGFINFTLAKGSAAGLVQVILSAGNDYGKGSSLSGTTFNIEFISANPTGPLHLGHTRWAAVGDAIARVLDANGAKVTREFYINDRGVQMDKFGLSVQAAALGNPIPEDGYHGQYIKELADEIVKINPDVLKLDGEAQFIEFREAAYALQLKQQQDVLDNFNTHFDVWTSERRLHESGAVEKGLEVLKKHGHLFELDGALWLRTTDYGDDKDRVLRKSNGELTYFASDTAYYVDKRSRGFDVCIYLLGADHHGYVNRLKAVAACAGDNPEVNVEVPIGQLVKMMKGGQEVRLSKRAGNIITLEDLVDEVGVDAARYTLIRYPVDTPLLLDLDLLIQRTNDNPVYYVQYAHARIASVLRQAGDLKIDYKGRDFVPEALLHEKESELLGTLAQYPSIVEKSAELRQPHRIARYLEELANAYHKFYDACRVLPQGEAEVTETNIARLYLCEATKQVLANGLDLCGVSAPERM